LVSCGLVLAAITSYLVGIPLVINGTMA